jgi:hypothetical protein
MISSLESIKQFWSGDSLDIDDAEKDENGKTAFDRFLLSAADDVAKRLRRWVGKESFADAVLQAPADPDRKDAIAEAEINLLHAAILDHLMRIAASGVEKDISLPSGSRISLKDWAAEDYKAQIEDYTGRANRAVLEYL